MRGLFWELLGVKTTFYHQKVICQVKCKAVSEFISLVFLETFCILTENKRNS
jgi:hypothetical protein